MMSLCLQPRRDFKSCPSLSYSTKAVISIDSEFSGNNMKYLQVKGKLKEHQLDLL